MKHEITHEIFTFCDGVVLLSCAGACPLLCIIIQRLAIINSSAGNLRLLAERYCYQDTPACIAFAYHLYTQQLTKVSLPFVNLRLAMLHDPPSFIIPAPK